MRLATPVLLTALALAAPARPADDPGEAPKLVRLLGSADFLEREDATRRLDALGPVALADLRAAARSDNPEVAARAKELVRRAERHADNARTLAPTVVELDATDAPLDDVLAALSKQAGFEVVLGGAKATDLAGRKVTVKTGQVPFWDAIRQLCAAAQLRVASVGGFAAPGAAPHNPRPGQRADGVAVRRPLDSNRGVVLEARDGPARPASVSGAVMVEAFELPKEAASKVVAATVLQVWPEPKLAWREAGAARGVAATGPGGGALVPEAVPPAVPQGQRLGKGEVVARNPDGSITFVDLGTAGPAVGPNFTPNARQALVTLRPGAATAATLEGTVSGTVRSGVGPLARAALDPDKEATATGPNGTALVAGVFSAEGKTFVRVRLAHDRARVGHAARADDLPGVRPGTGDGTVLLGLRVTDADDRPYRLGVRNQTCGLDTTQQLIVRTLVLEVIPEGGGAAAPTHVTFWGSYDKSVGVPFTLTSVPLTGGSK